MERLITRLELDCALAIESKERSTEEQRTDDERQSRLEDAAAATVTRRGKISGRFTRIGTRGRDQDRRDSTKTDTWITERDATLFLSLLYNGRERESRYATYSNTIPTDSGKSAVWRMGLRSGRSYP